MGHTIKTITFVVSAVILFFFALFVVNQTAQVVELSSRLSPGSPSCHPNPTVTFAGAQQTCSACHALLIERYGYVIMDYRLTDDGRCPECNSQAPGIWGRRKEVRLGGPEGVRRRIPRPLQTMRSGIPTL